MRLTKGELYDIDIRVDTIEATLALCHPDFDCDVIENLELELIQIIETLETSLKIIEEAS